VKTAIEIPGAVIFPAADGAPVIYAHMSRESVEEIACELPAALVLIDCDWDRDLTPWAAARVFKGGNDFAGQADAHLERIARDIIPAAEAALGYTPPWRGIAGYSLGGLFAVYAVWKSTLFSRAASMSGSLWYDGFTDFLADNTPRALPDAVYLSVGERESRTRNARMAEVERCTELAAARLRSLGCKTEYNVVPGGHFDDVGIRITNGIEFITR